MLFTSILRKSFLKTSFVLLAPLTVFFSQFSETTARVVTIEKKSSLGVIKGVVRDERGNPISNAIVAVFKPGVDGIYQLIKANSKGNYIAKILPGTYMIIAAAQGYNTSTIPSVQISRSTELNYGFNLVRIGSGNTLPEKSAERYSGKVRTRAAHIKRSIYQNQEGKTPIDETQDEVFETESVADSRERNSKRKAQSVVETYFASSNEGAFSGLNFATLQPISENTEIIFSGQTGTKSFAPSRFETTLKSRLNENHQVRVSTSIAKVGQVKIDEIEKQLGQVSVQAFDEWRIKDGIILVLGFDYSRFVGAGDDSSIAPRFGLQVDVNSKTRFRTAYTTQNEEKTWSDVIDFEGSQVLFRQQFEPRAIALEEDTPQMFKSRRFEFGVERVLDNKSTVEAVAFFDSISGRGVGLTRLPVNALSQENFSQFETTTQEGRAEGLRVVYSRRLNGIFSTSAGYSFGTGQRVSQQAISNPNNVFENSLFQTFVAQLNSDFRTGTSIQTVFRLSPQATVFAVDPFQGRLAIYDPGLSIVVTQSLPTLGLPIRATAIIDARNLFDFQNIVSGEDGSLQLNLSRRTLRGGISVRF